MKVKQYPEIVQRAILQEHIRHLDAQGIYDDFDELVAEEKEEDRFVTLKSIADCTVGSLFSLLSRHSIDPKFNQGNDEYFWLQLLRGDNVEAVKLVKDYFIFNEPSFESITIGEETFNI